MKLMHRDSPLSPFYQPSMTSEDRFRAMIERSISRGGGPSAAPSSAPGSSSSARSQVTPNDGDYLMELEIGTPPVKIVAIADTGSDLVWVQCKPCDKCYNQTDPIFDSTKSSTFNDSVLCNDTMCIAILPFSSCGDKLRCEYIFGYGDGSASSGNLARDTFTFSSDSNNKRNNAISSSSSSTFSIPDIFFGCSHSSDGLFTPKADGLIGLGGGAASLVRQLDSTIHGKFSYCLAPYSENTTSILNMGDNSVVNGPDLVTIPMTSSNYTFYLISLHSITIGKQTIPYTPDDTTHIVVDSGTTITYLPEFALTKIMDAVSKTINLTKTKDPQNYLPLCYNHSVKDPPYPFPNITFNFDNQPGHDQVSVVLTGTQTFVQSTDDVICLGMDYSAVSHNIAIFGNVAQQNMHVAYDLHANVISMTHADCSKLSSA
ncbi:Aspartic peptidase A1 family protein [Dioscorea alata]|uniref:Aspartic peptidase A1 family protein n=1 Tax=Dioscorea alata TaxID=55571 RepID=A0ACB7UFE6_DIOAL|nr:Aspartic peptidase A1 family protein [Dioscorea alata]